MSKSGNIFQFSPDIGNLIDSDTRQIFLDAKNNSYSITKTIEKIRNNIYKKPIEARYIDFGPHKDSEGNIRYGFYRIVHVSQREKYRHRIDKKEKPIEFIKRVYGEFVGYGLTRSHIKKYDPPLYNSLSVWLHRNGSDEKYAADIEEFSRLVPVVQGQRLFPDQQARVSADSTWVPSSEVSEEVLKRRRELARERARRHREKKLKK